MEGCQRNLVCGQCGEGHIHLKCELLVIGAVEPAAALELAKHDLECIGGRRLDPGYRGAEIAHGQIIDQCEQAFRIGAQVLDSSSGRTYQDTQDAFVETEHPAQFSSDGCKTACADVFCYRYFPHGIVFFVMND